MAFQSTINSQMALGKPGTIARVNPVTSIPALAEGDAVVAGAFVFAGTDPESQVRGASADTAAATEVAGLCVFEKFQAALGGLVNLNSLNINEGEEVAVLKRGYAYIAAATVAAHGDKVFVNTTTGEVTFGTGDASEGTIDTLWRVETGAQAGQVCEIYRI